MRNSLRSFRIGRGQSPTTSKLVIGSLPARRIGQVYQPVRSDADNMM